MTKLLPNKPVTRETEVFERAERLIVVLHPRYLEVRIKGRRAGVSVPYDAVLDLGRKMAARRSA